MDIVQHIKQHTKDLQHGLMPCSPEQLKKLKLAVLGFYYQLPDFEAVVNRHLHLNITKNQLSADIETDHLEYYRDAIKKSNAAMDEYAEDYEEPEAIEIFILESLDNAVATDNSSQNVVSLFIGVINTLDYYENFSDEPQYWNNLLEQELAFQKEILIAAEKKDFLDNTMYQKRYTGVDFAIL